MPYSFPDDEITAFYAGESTHAGDVFGCHSDGASGWRFCLWAPNALGVSVVGDFNGWDESAHPMETYRGLWACIAPEARPGDNYKYRIRCQDGTYIMKADPYAAHAETPPGTASKVWDARGYAWGDAAWMAKRADSDIINGPLSIYELHLGSWRVKDGYDYPSYLELAEELPAYVKGMGFTHVELMPVGEHPFGGSWGYQVTGFFGITSRHGTPQDFMLLVDRLHAEGIGVIVDWVPAHFPKDAHGLARFDGTWLYEHAHPLRREHPQWGTHEFNYNRPEVCSFLVSSAVNLIENYHIDGLRVDAVSSMLYLDYGREGRFIRAEDGGNIDRAAVAFVKRFNEAALGGGTGAMTIAEESTAYPLVTRPPYDGGLGFTFKWNMGFMHDTLGYLATDPYFRAGSHGRMTFSMHYAFSENYILPYSHDEVVHGKASMIGKMFGDYVDRFRALKTLYGFLYGHPGKKLMFMGGEFAQFIEWDYQKQLDWFLLDFPAHADMQAWVRALNRMYAAHPALWADDGGWDGFRWLNVDDSKNSVFAFERICKAERIVCVYNFSPIGQKGYLVALPQGGMLRPLLSSEWVAQRGGAIAGPEVGGGAQAGGAAMQRGDAAQDGVAVQRCGAAQDGVAKQDGVAMQRGGAAQEGVAVQDGDCGPRLPGVENDYYRKQRGIRALPVAHNGMPYAAKLTVPPLSAQFYIYAAEEGKPKARKEG